MGGPFAFDVAGGDLVGLLDAEAHAEELVAEGVDDGEERACLHLRESLALRTSEPASIRWFQRRRLILCSVVSWASPSRYIGGWRP